MSPLLASLFALSGTIQRRLAWLPPAVARLTLGWVFLQSGWGKLQNLDRVVSYFSSLGIPAPGIQAPFVAGTEFVCGALLLAGLATRIAALPLIAVMLVALGTAVADQIGGFSDLLGLAEFLYIVVLLGLAVSGGGALSLDAQLAKRWPADRPRVVQE